MKRIFALGLIVVFVLGFGLLASAQTEYRFVIVPKVEHLWFDKVNQGALEMAQFLSEQTGDLIVIDYRAPVDLKNDTAAEFPLKTSSKARFFS